MKTYTMWGVTRTSHHDYKYASRDMYGKVRFHTTRDAALRMAGASGTVEKIKALTTTAT